MATMTATTTKDDDDETANISSAAAAAAAAAEEDGEEEEGEIVDDWDLPMDFAVAARHETHAVYLGAGPGGGRTGEAVMTVKIRCMERLTPIDVVTPSSSGEQQHDGTGHCAWTGAFLFVALLGEIRDCFRGRRVLELGCGTGLGGIAVLVTSEPAHVTLTDADPAALALCRRNCELNGIPPFSASADRRRRTPSSSVETLSWGDRPAGGRYDAVFATDVLYDIAALPALLRTASSSLAETFVLSHVPRACHASDVHPPVDDLERHIVATAAEHGFRRVERLLRPRDHLSTRDWNPPADALNRVTWQEMDDAGAALFVFSKK
jgi:ribosomal protein L11 methylase PrmA